MKQEDQRMMTILYSPASYTHASHLPEIVGSKAILNNEVLINYWILRQYQLSNLPGAWQPADPTLALLLTHWYQIPAAAHLTGGYLLRSRLPEQGAMLMTDPRLLAFISLPLLHQVSVADRERQPDTTAYGAAFILNLFPCLPLALRQRLLLHFPAEMKLPDLSAPKTLNHINLLRMALTYAHYYS